MRGGSLRSHRDFRFLWVGDSVSQLGTFVGNTAIPLLAVGLLAASPLEMGVLTAAETAAFLLLGLPAGAWVDRLKRRPVMIFADLIRVVLMLSVPAVWFFGLLTIEYLIIIVFLVGIATVFFDVAYQSYLPALVHRDHLAEGHSKLQASQSVGQVAGPGLGGFLTQAIGAANVVLLTGLGYLVSAGCLLRIRGKEDMPVRASLPNLRIEILEGLRYVFSEPRIRSIALCSATSSFFNASVMAIEVLFLRRTVGLSEGEVGIALAAMGVGGVLGAVTAHRWLTTLGFRALWLVPLVTWPAYVLFPLAQPGFLTYLGVTGAAVFSAGVVAYNVISVTFRQQVCPDRLLGRMNASVRFLVWGTMPIGALAGGVFASIFGLRPTLFVSTLGILLGIIWLVVARAKYRPSTSLVSATSA